MTSVLQVLQDLDLAHHETALREHLILTVDQLRNLDGVNLNMIGFVRMDERMRLLQWIALQQDTNTNTNTNSNNTALVAAAVPRQQGAAANHAVNNPGARPPGLNASMIVEPVIQFGVRTLVRNIINDEEEDGEEEIDIVEPNPAVDEDDGAAGDEGVFLALAEAEPIWEVEEAGAGVIADEDPVGGGMESMISTLAGLIFG